MSRILNSAFVWIGSATHSTSDAFRQRQRERIRRMQNNDAGGVDGHAAGMKGRYPKLLESSAHAGDSPVGEEGSTQLNPEKRRPERGALPEFQPAGIKPGPASPFARKEGK